MKVPGPVLIGVPVKMLVKILEAVKVEWMVEVQVAKLAYLLANKCTS